MQTLTNHGIEIDSNSMELHLPAEKLNALILVLKSFEGQKKCTILKKLYYR